MNSLPSNQLIAAEAEPGSSVWNRMGLLERDLQRIMKGDETGLAKRVGMVGKIENNVDLRQSREIRVQCRPTEHKMNK